MVYRRYYKYKYEYVWKTGRRCDPRYRSWRWWQIGTGNADNQARNRWKEGQLKSEWNILYWYVYRCSRYKYVQPLEGYRHLSHTCCILRRRLRFSLILRPATVAIVSTFSPFFPFPFPFPFSFVFFAFICRLYLPTYIFVLIFLLCFVSLRVYSYWYSDWLSTKPEFDLIGICNFITLQPIPLWYSSRSPVRVFSWLHFLNITRCQIWWVGTYLPTVCAYVLRLRVYRVSVSS